MTTYTGVAPPATLYAKDSHTPSWLDEPVEFKDVASAWLSGSLLVATFTSTQPVAENPNTYTAIRLPGFSDDFYNRIIIEPSVLDVGSIVSSQTRVLSVFNGYFTSKTLGALVLTNGTGISLIGPSIPAVWGPLQVRTYDVNLSPVGPPNIAASLFFDWAGSVDDSTVPVSGVRIVVMPYQATAPWQETLEWNTQVMTANNGTEQRQRLRQSPRQSFTATYPVKTSEMARAVNLVYGWLTRRWAIPVWSEAQQLVGLTVGMTVITLNVTDFDFRVGELIGFWQSPTANEAVEVAAIGSGTITLLTALVRSYDIAHVYPVRVGRVNGNIQRQSNGYMSDLQLTFDVLQNIDLATASPPQYLGQDLYTDPSLFDGDTVSDTFDGRVDVVDYGGLTEEFAPWLNNKTTRPYKVIKDDPADIRAFKLWLFRRAGRLRPFWYPTFEVNLRLASSGAITNTIRVWADDYQFVGNQHNHIAIKFTAGTWTPRAVVAVAAVAGGDFLDISFDGSALSVDASTLAYVSFLALKRLNSDKITLEHQTNGVMVSAVAVTEISP